MFPTVPTIQNPEEMLESAITQARSAAQLLGYSLGLNGTDLQTIYENGIPKWAIAVVAFAAGAIVVARWAPEPWVAKVRMFGTRG